MADQDIEQPSGSDIITASLTTVVQSKWHDKEQEKVNQFLEEWVRMIKDELREKEATILEIMARLNLQDEKIAERVHSKEYQSLVRKTFREWAGAESESKREWIRNVLANAAAGSASSDDVVRLFIDWLGSYSELHFQVIAKIYEAGQRGISRGQIWSSLSKPAVREDSADADLYKLLIRDLSTGGIIRQHRETDYNGNFIAKQPAKRSPAGIGKAMTSAFDEVELYELTELGKQFVHYAMSDLPLKVEYRYAPDTETKSEKTE